MNLEKDPLEVECPFCGAPEGEPCRNVFTQKLLDNDASHGARVRLVTGEQS